MDNIAFMVSNLSILGGTERVTALLSRELNKFYNCSIITFYRPGKIVYEIDKNIEVFNLYEKKYRLREVWLDSILKISKFIKERDIKVIVVVGRNNGILPILLKPFCKAKIVYCEHNSINAYKMYNFGFAKRVWKKIFQYLVNNHTDMVVTLTDTDLNYYKKKNIRSCKIPNFLDEKLLHNGFCYNNYSKKILTVARIDYQKGIEFLLEAANTVLHHYPDWEWHIYGGFYDVDYKRKIESLQKKYHLEKKVIFKGNSENVYEVYKDYSFFVLTSRYEGFGMVLLEAKSYNLPTLSFNIESGPSEIIREGIDGYLIEPFDIAKMSEKIEYLIKHEEKRIVFSKNARGNLNDFSKEVVINQWKQLLDKFV